MGDVYRAIAERLQACHIDLEQYIDHNLGRKAGLRQGYEEGPTTLEGIKFISKTSPDHAAGEHLKDAFHLAHTGRKRLFAGQVHEEDLANGPLQASFGATDGLGFREIFYPDFGPALHHDPGRGRLPSEDSRNFAAKFGRMDDARNIESLHADLAPTGARWSKIHIDQEGFVYADRDGRIFLSSNFAQHVGDELLIKDKLLSGSSPLSFFFHTDANSISDPARGHYGTAANRFTERRMPRGTLGLELATKPTAVQFFVRGSMGIEADGLRPPKLGDVSGTAGFRFRWGGSKARR